MLSGSLRWKFESSQGALPLANLKGQALYDYWAKDKERIGLTLK